MSRVFSGMYFEPITDEVKMVSIIEKAIDENQEFIAWIKKQRILNNAALASLCRGAFLLAETGLINGKKCSTHWTVHDKFTKIHMRISST